MSFDQNGKDLYRNVNMICILKVFHKPRLGVCDDIQLSFKYKMLYYLFNTNYSIYPMVFAGLPNSVESRKLPFFNIIIALFDNLI